jgi:hypothetical protein
MGSERNKFVPRVKRIKIDQEQKTWRKESLVAKKAR